jgi:hypothetical protein
VRPHPDPHAASDFAATYSLAKSFSEHHHESLRKYLALGQAPVTASRSVLVQSDVVPSSEIEGGDQPGPDEKTNTVGGGDALTLDVS